MDLEVARESAAILLAQYDEGRASLSEMEQARFEENEKWIAYFDAQNTLERVKLDILRLTGSLIAALK